MESGSARPVARPAPRGALALGLVLLVFGLGVGAYGGWSLASALGPRSTTSGRVVDLDHVMATGKSGSDRWLVHVAWDGGSGDLDDRSLYDALAPLEGQPDVVVEHSRLTGAVLRVELGGQWYVAPQGSTVLGIGDLLVGGVLIVAAIAVAFFRDGARRALARVPRRPLRYAGVATLVAVPLAIAALGAWSLAAAVGPRTTTPGHAVAAAQSYVDVVWPGGRARLTDGHLTLAVGVARSIATSFHESTDIPVTVERSRLDGTVVGIVLDERRYDVGPGVGKPIAMLVFGLVALAGLLALLLSSRRRTPGLRRQTVSPGPTDAKP